MDAKRDINWFLIFLPTFNGTTFFEYRPINVTMELDASLQGLGARWGNQVYTLTIPLGHNTFNICYLEMLNILLALRVWKDQCSNSKISIACDNQVVVQVLNSGKTRDLTLAAIARNIQFHVATRNIDLKVTHIPGKSNVIADLLSRWILISQLGHKLSQMLPHYVLIPVNKELIDTDWSI